MANFCKCGADEYICQECGGFKCSKEEPSKWMFVKRTAREGNLCEACQRGEAELIHKMMIAAHKRGGGMSTAWLARYGELMGG